VNVGECKPSGMTIDALQTVFKALAYYKPHTRDMVIFVVHKVIHNIQHLAHNLLSIFQMRLNNVVVNETPKFQCKRPTDCDHAIIIKG
jgi:hypothetical protein